jgi:hypothetical protein
VGVIRSQIDHKGRVVLGVTLGDPRVEHEDGSPHLPEDGVEEDLWLAWEHRQLPDGTLDELGVLTLDP